MCQNPISTLANHGITWYNQPWHEWDVTLFTGTWLKMPSKHAVFPIDRLNSGCTNGKTTQPVTLPTTPQAEELCGASPPDRLPFQWAVQGNSLNYLRAKGPMVRGKSSSGIVLELLEWFRSKVPISSWDGLHINRNPSQHDLFWTSCSMIARHPDPHIVSAMNKCLFPSVQPDGRRPIYHCWVTLTTCQIRITDCGVNPSEKYESQLRLLFPTEWKNKIHVPNHQPAKCPEFQLPNLPHYQPSWG